MKNLFFYFRTLVVLALLFISCDRKEDDGTNTATSSTAGFTWREDSQTAPEQNVSCPKIALHKKV